MTGSIENRESFLANLNQRLGNPRYTPYEAISDLPQSHLADKTPEELLAICREKAVKVNAQMVEITSDQLNETLAQLIEAAGGGPIAIPDDPQFAEYDVALPQDHPIHQWQKGADKREVNVTNCQNANVAVAFARFLCAESATIVVESSAGQGRVLHFLPAHYISLIPMSRLVPRSTQAAAYFEEKIEKGETTGSAYHFISGPSNSGDIEMQLVTGLHGPLEVHYVIIKDR